MRFGIKWILVIQLNSILLNMQEVQTMNIGHYILGKTIGKGAFAKVKEATHDLTGIKVAVKIINKKKMKNKNMISKVKRQIKILKFINHPNIIKLYEVLDTTNDIFVIMELASNGELYEFIQNQKMDEQQARFYFRQIMTGVEYIHQNLIVHRDLKPENILIDENNLIKIGDFGLSNLMKDGKLLKTACGSPNYAAPQIVGQRKYQGTSVDVWSCGVILFALLVGYLPFDEEIMSLLYKKIEQGNYKIPEFINPFARDLISRMLQVDPSKRIKIHQIKNHPWLRTQIPIYAKISTVFTTQRQEEFELDEPVYQEITKMDFNFQNYSKEMTIKSIKKREDESFVIAYELLKDEKDRKLFAQENKLLESESKVTIFQKYENKPKEEVKNQSLPSKSFIYGFNFRNSARNLADVILQILKVNGIEFSIKSSDYNIRCHYSAALHRKGSGKFDDDTKMDLEVNEKEPKFNRNEVKFIIQIYSIVNDPLNHRVDFQLVNGHPFIFFSCVRKINFEIEEFVNPKI